MIGLDMSLFTTFVAEHWLPLVGAAISFVWVWLEYRASIWLWPVGIILPLFYIVIGWEARFLGSIATNAYYFVTSIIGWVIWLRGGGDGEKPITHLPRRWGAVILSSSLPLVALLCLLMQGYSAQPHLDAISTVASFIGMILLGRKHLEHWICWMVANSTGAVVFIIAQDYISAVVFAVNLGMSIAGYRHWRQLLQAQANV